MNLRLLANVPLIILGVLLVVLGLAVTFGGPTPPPPMASINDPFKSVDFSSLPAVATYPADDGQPLAYRQYVPVGEPRGTVTLVHGSSASGHSMHPMAKALSAAGLRVFTLDMRGHGQSGTKGHIAHVGQLDEDLAAFVRAVRPPSPSTLVGFSAGGGFVLRVAGGPRQADFDSYLLLAPFISQDAPNQRPDSGGWVDIGIPRLIGLSMLNAVGVRAFNSLPVVAFALNEQAKAFLTPQYDFNLAVNFRPPSDYRATIRSAARPASALIGTADEAFLPDRLEGIFREAGRPWDVELVPDIGHIPLTLDPRALAAVVRHVQKLQARPAGS